MSGSAEKNKKNICDRCSNQSYCHSCKDHSRFCGQTEKEYLKSILEHMTIKELFKLLIDRRNK